MSDVRYSNPDWNRDLHTNKLTDYDQEYDRVMIPDSTLNSNRDVYSNRDTYKNPDVSHSRDSYTTHEKSRNQNVYNNRGHVYSKHDVHNNRNVHSYHDVKSKLDMHDSLDMSSKGYYDIDSNRDKKSKLDRYMYDDRDMNSEGYHDIDIDRHVKIKLDRHDDRDMNSKDYRDNQNNRDVNSKDYRDVHNSPDMNSKDYRDIHSNRYVKSIRGVHDDRYMKSNRYRDIDSNRDDKRVPDTYKHASSLNYGVSYSSGATPECTVNMSYGNREPWNTHSHYRDADQYTHTDYTKDKETPITAINELGQGEVSQATNRILTSLDWPLPPWDPPKHNSDRLMDMEEEQRLAKNKGLRRIRVHSNVELILSLLAIGSGIWVLVAARDNITFPTFNFGPIVIGLWFLSGAFLGLHAAKRGLAEAKEDTLSTGVKRWVVRHFVVCVISIGVACIAATFGLMSARICFDPDPVIYKNKHGDTMNLSESCVPNKTGNAAAGLVSGLICLMVALWAIFGTSILIRYQDPFGCMDPRGAVIQRRLDIQRRDGQRSAVAKLENSSTA